VLRGARLSARLSQTDLARRAGVPQSVVSAYENGRREPSLSTLRRLVESTGQSLDVRVMPSRPIGLPDTVRGRLLRRRRAAARAVAARYGATGLRVFGSVARGDDRPDSDIDLAVDLPATASLVDLAGLKRELGDALHAAVDVVPLRGLRSDVAEAVAHEGIFL